MAVFGLDRGQPLCPGPRWEPRRRRPGGYGDPAAKTLEPGYALKSVVSAGSERPGRGGGASRAAKDLARRVANLVLQPDAQILWKLHAVREGMRLLREVPHAAIVATGPPFSSFLVGSALSRRTGLPLVLDYRDEWDLSNSYWENKRPDRLSQWVQRRMQQSVVRSARSLVATTRSSARALEIIRNESGSDAEVAWIYNGFDPDDFPAAPPVPREADRPYRLAYVGTLWNLTSAEPLVEGVCRLALRRPDLAAALELVFAGRRTGPQEQVLRRLDGLPCRLTEHPYVDHRAAVDLIRSADGLCTLLADLPGAGRVVPAKIFESMAALRPIWVIAPRGEVWDLLEDYPARHRIEPGDIEGIADQLAQEIAWHRQGKTPDLSGWDGSRFDRRNQARQLAGILESLAGRVTLRTH